MFSSQFFIYLANYVKSSLPASIANLILQSDNVAFLGACNGIGSKLAAPCTKGYDTDLKQDFVSANTLQRILNENDNF
jgi:hypothetical protein